MHNRQRVVRGALESYEVHDAQSAACLFFAAQSICEMLTAVSGSRGRLDFFAAQSICEMLTAVSESRGRVMLFLLFQ